MAILRVDDFSATADVLGMIKQIRYSKAEQMLCIEATSADEAVAILGQLSIGKVSGLTAETTPAGEQELVATAFEAAAPEPAAPAPEPTPAPKAKAPAPVPVQPTEAAPSPPEEPEPGKAAKAAPAEEPPKKPAKRKPRKVRKLANDITSTPEPVAESAPDPAPAPVPATTPAPVEQSEAPAPAPSNGAGSNGISADLRNATKMRDVISIIYDEGGKDVDSILARCREVQPHIPVLARVRNLDDRVRRAIEVMGIIE